MNYHLICVHPFGIFAKGDKITDRAEVAKHLADREHHFVRVPAPDEPVPAPAAPASSPVASRSTPVSDLN